MGYVLLTALSLAFTASCKSSGSDVSADLGKKQSEELRAADEEHEKKIAQQEAAKKAYAEIFNKYLNVGGRPERMLLLSDILHRGEDGAPLMRSFKSGCYTKDEKVADKLDLIFSLDEVDSKRSFSEIYRDRSVTLLKVSGDKRERWIPDPLEFAPQKLGQEQFIKYNSYDRDKFILRVYSTEDPEQKGSYEIGVNITDNRKAYRRVNIWCE